MFQAEEVLLEELQCYCKGNQGGSHRCYGKDFCSKSVIHLCRCMLSKSCSPSMMGYMFVVV